MNCKVVTIFSMLSIIAYGNEANQKSHYAVSTQSFYQNDSPLYKYSAVHDYKRPNVDKTQQGHSIYGHQESPVRIQYAPLPHEFKTNGQQRHEEKQLEHKPITVHISERQVYSTEGGIQKGHLEPRVVTQFAELKPGPRSFIPGHNVEVLPPPRDRYLGHVDPFVTRPDTPQKQQVTAPKFVYYQKKMNYYDNTPAHQKVEKPTDDLNLLGFVTKDSNEPFMAKESRAAPSNAYSSRLHNQLSGEKPAQSYQYGPRLHLNIGRFYNVANQQQKAPISSAENHPIETPQRHVVNLSQAHSRIANNPGKAHYTHTNVMKPPIRTQKFFMPRIVESQNTILYPAPGRGQ